MVYFCCMTWRRGPQDFSRLHALGNLTARLIRLNLFERIQRGDAQLHAHGIPSELTELYKEHALAERYTLIPQKSPELENYVRAISTDESIF